MSSALLVLQKMVARFDGHVIMYTPKELIRYQTVIVRDKDKTKLRNVEMYACRNLFSMVLTPYKEIIIRMMKQTDRTDDRMRAVIAEAIATPVDLIQFDVDPNTFQIDTCTITDGQVAVMLALKYEL